jgi:hypothetical protein
VFSNGEQDYLGLQSELTSAYGDWIDLNVIPLYPPVVKRFVANQPFQLLLRPDNYVGLISTDLSFHPLKAYFERLLKQS